MKMANIILTDETDLDSGDDEYGVVHKTLTGKKYRWGRNPATGERIKVFV